MQRVAITGGRGLVGSALRSFLTDAGHNVRIVTRSPRTPDDITWNPSRGEIEIEKLAGCDSVVHLAGESLFGRWTKEKKRRIRESRLQGTRLLCESLAKAETPPQTLISASAVGYYGNRGDERLTEESTPGDTFLAKLCQEWEAACEPARAAGIRVVTPRIGPVLSLRSGLLATVLPLFKLGLGGQLAGGRQWMSWITLDDLVDIFHAAMSDESLAGVINATAPNPVTNGEFTKTLAAVLHRPALLPVPRFGLGAVLGSEGADELALTSARVEPTRLLEQGHEFHHPHLKAALRQMLVK